MKTTFLSRSVLSSCHHHLLPPFQTGEETAPLSSSVVVVSNIPFLAAAPLPQEGVLFSGKRARRLTLERSPLSPRENPLSCVPECGVAREERLSVPPGPEDNSKSRLAVVLSLRGLSLLVTVA